MPKIDIKHITPNQQKFNGIYRGVVEDNKDPEKLGRVKVRIYGIHDKNKNKESDKGVPVEDLAWAEPCLGLFEGSVSGYGAFSVPLQGSHVFVFFEGGNWISPRYFATVPGKPEEKPNSNEGFSDPNDEFPVDHRIGESDYHRLSRGEKNETVIQHRDDNVDKGVTKAGGGTWDEPESSYKAEYPFNTVIATHRGIVIEIDSTHGEERLHIYHPSNSYVEIDKDGNIVFRNDKDYFRIIKGESNKHVFEDDNETIDVDKTKNIGNDETVEIGNDRNVDIGNNDDKTIGGNWTVKVGGDINIEADGNITLKGSRIDLNP